MTVIATPPKLQFFSDAGVPLSGGKVYTYAAGTTTPLATYTDSGGLTANANPVVLNSRGEASIWFGTSQYKLVLKTSDDVQIWSVDNLNGPDTTTYNAAVAAAVAQVAATGSAATLTNTRTLTVGSTGKSFNGSANVAWTLAEIGAAASGANTDITALDQDITVTATGTIAANTIGYRGMPQLTKTASYTLALADAGKHISITTGGIVIPANGSVAFPIGTAIVIYNDSASTQAITITTDTLRQAGTANTGARTLLAYGLATLVKVAATTWVITGTIS